MERRECVSCVVRLLRLVGVTEARAVGGVPNGLACEGTDPGASTVLNASEPGERLA
jgi:hypothetical protein